MLDTVSLTVAPFMIGEGSVARLGMKVRELGMKKPFVCCDKGVYDCGSFKAVQESLEASNIDYVLFTGVLPDPSDVSVDEAAAVARENKCDGVINVGGGSALDTGKAVSALLGNEGKMVDYLLPNMPGPAGIPIINIPTTAGTGAEHTVGGVLCDTSNDGKKTCYGIMDPISFIFIDPSLTVTMPVRPSTYSAFDIVTHTLDAAICAPYAEELGVTLGKEATRLVGENLEKMIADPSNIVYREKLALAATYAGVCLTNSGCPTMFTHSIGHTIGAKYHIPHGLACGLCLPQILERYASLVPEGTRTWCDCMGWGLDASLSDEEYGKAAKKACQDYFKRINMPTFKELGFTLEQILEAVPGFFSDHESITFVWPTEDVDEDYFKQLITDVFNEN